ncbi:MAG: radical SAM protein [Deltaproteobacteria bacterium]|nr:radical SAM protein [Deltaproteobacteria bacterium]
MSIPRPHLPSYLSLFEAGELARRARAASRRLEACDLCPRTCGKNRRAGERGACRSAERAVVASYGPHHGEEECLSGSCGSGTIFFSGCNLGCVFCQNWEISHVGGGTEVGPAELAAMMLELQAQGCHNVNFVSPSHVIPQLLAAVEVAAGRGLRLPLVYNTGGYDSLESLALLDGVVDLYMPDMKYGDSALGRKYSKVANYVEVNRGAVKEMHRQVGDLVVDDHGLARRGLLVRHLVMPDGISGSEEVFTFLAEGVSRDTYVNVMDQYRPCHRAGEYPALARRVSHEEVRQALRSAERHGLRLDRRRPASLRLF